MLLSQRTVARALAVLLTLSLTAVALTACGGGRGVPCAPGSKGFPLCGI